MTASLGEKSKALGDPVTWSSQPHRGRETRDQESRGQDLLWSEARVSSGPEAGRAARGERRMGARQDKQEHSGQRKKHGQTSWGRKGLGVVKEPEEGPWLKESMVGRGQHAGATGGLSS